MATASKLIAILGATGNQGGSVVETFLANGWRVRAITRSTSSEKAKALTKRGAEVVQANLDDTPTLLKAFEGAQVVFAVSDFWGIYADPTYRSKAKADQPFNKWSGHHELQQLKNSIDAAAKTSSLERFIISSLPNATRESGGKYTHIYHFDSKADAEKYGKDKYPDLWAKTSVYIPAFFLTNFTQYPILKPVKVCPCVSKEEPWCRADELL
jgi:nucleoside-diphosphate-sugar epimerase